MFSFSRLPLSDLIELCRALHHYLGAGLTLRDVFQHQARKGRPALRPVAARICTALAAGDDLEQALKQERNAFPPLFVALASVGEQTGMLPEVCRELEHYFVLQQSLRRQFLGLIAWPAFQLVAAIFVVTGLIWVLGVVAEMNPGSQGFDPVGLGTGKGPALGFLFGAFGTLAALAGLYLVAKRLFHGGAIDGWLLRLPAIGPCLRALALTRFCLGMRLTHETGMAVTRAVRLGLQATGNGAFVAATDRVLQAVRDGEDLTAALSRSRLFPEEFLHVLSVGEESGRLTEVLEQQGDQYQGESERRLRVLAMAASGVVWMIVGLIIVIAIFRIFLTYLGMLDPARYGV